MPYCTRTDLAARLADLAAGIAQHIDTDPESIVRAHCLSANAYRIARLPDATESALSRIVELVEPTSGCNETLRAFYFRTLALLRWDQRRLDEALDLLQQAEDLFANAKERTEQLASKFLIALLHDEMGRSDEVAAAIGRLLGCWFDPSWRPWLTSRALLTFTAIAADNRPKALFALEEGLRLQAYVSDDEEQLRLLALEGRARARLGFLDEAEEMIEGVRRHHLAARGVIDLTLSSLDLLAHRIASGQPPGVDELVCDIESIGHEPSPTAELSSTALGRFVTSVGGDKDPWKLQRELATWYLQTLRLRGIHPPPIPFV